MTVEADIVTALRTVCPRVSPDVAEWATARPYITWQFIGGTTLRSLNGTPFDKRHTLLQVNVWADRREEALALVRQVETALCDGAAPFTARPEGEPVNDVADDIEPKRYASIQDFSIHSTR